MKSLNFKFASGNTESSYQSTESIKNPPNPFKAGQQDSSKARRMTGSRVADSRAV
jgi:hypothetical protein